VPLKTGGFPALTTMAFDHPDAAPLATLLTVRMLDHGILAGGGFYPTLAHADRELDVYMTAANQVLPELGTAAEDGSAAARLGSPVRHTGFARLT
jgi:glutamate-1-semialdehyde 2,1-aminomutase